MVEVDPGPRAGYFWAHQFRLAGGEGGYLGLQSMGSRVDGSKGKLAIFSIWDAVGASGPGAVRFDGEGSGWSCRIPYEWETERPYLLEVWTDSPSSWSAAVTDDHEVTTEIGRIEVPRSWRQLESWSVMWTEHFAPPLSTCADLAYSSVVFGTPTADGGKVSPDHSSGRLGDGTCDGSSVYEVPGGVRHEMGSG